MSNPPPITLTTTTGGTVDLHDLVSQVLLAARQNNGGKEVKAGLPDKFSGDTKETRFFLSHVDDYITINPSMFPSERTKILFLKSFLGGTAYQWADSKTQAYGPDEILWPTYETFRDEFRTAYTPHNEKSKALSTLDRLRQD